MTTAEKLLKVSEGINKVEELNNTLETALNSGDTGVNNHYDLFWDNYQNYGEKIRYGYAFAGSGWTDETFKPKYDIKPTEASRIFAGTSITDLKGALEKAGVVIDLSKAVSMTYFTEAESIITHIPELNVTSLKSLQYFIYNAPRLVSVDKVILKSDGSQTFGMQSFGYLAELQEIRFEGVIGQNGFNIKDSKKLSKASITSIINALSTTTTGLTVTLSKAAVNEAFRVSPGVADGASTTEWLNLVATKPNWTISLV